MQEHWYYDSNIIKIMQHVGPDAAVIVCLELMNVLCLMAGFLEVVL